ncbi:MAG: 16S rRNA (adenine(1518)-N(6)/adenine(1519)-N(6))-dimethyltransferase RsmA [Neisseriaceae bacterium]|nr:16S rRNA (adenine(1518)-N(6)/adenine(1519)-N(6))-dimethyltransferase RsmA [Neisseriaceae bacterium]
MQHTARKRFGQNFLQDKGIINAIITAANIKEADTVIEIGPGLGALTIPLLQKVNHLHLIEIDKDIIEYLRTLPNQNQMDIHEGDVLRFDFNSIAGKKKIIGNLPYNISTPLLFKLTDYVDNIIDMHFMLQKEVVERMCANPNSKDYGRLSVMLQYFFDMEKIIDVPPEAFEPAPKVDSAVIRMIPDVGRIGIVNDINTFSQLLTQSFAMRRKTIRNNLKKIANDEEMAQVGINATMRPEDISPQNYVKLSNLLNEKAKNQG